MAKQHSIKRNASFQDLSGRTFSAWTVLEESKLRGNSMYWQCRCKCGKIKYVLRAALVAGTSRSCGCFPRKWNYIAIDGETATIELSDRSTLAFVDASDVHLVEKVFWWPFGIIGRYAAGHRRGGGVLYMHRVILGVTDAQIGVDHVDGNGLNNRRSNLRIASAAHNAANSRKRRSREEDVYTSLFKGVHRHSTSVNRFAAQITVNGRTRHLGLFKREVDAALAYDKAARELHGEFACLNFPNAGEQSARRA